MIKTYKHINPLRLAVVLAAASLSACVPTTPKASLTSINLQNEQALENGPTAGAELFTESAYGVAASPLMALGPRIPRGGGYEKVGSPYLVKGKRYYPTTSPQPVQVGRASWYGKAFHGRKTANGEIYDMTHLTAAHKTMPLPSYARVTNTANGHSVIVRVNDRGPFSNDRVMDLSKRAAEILDYTRAGTANVKVEYVGPAPISGQDDLYLISSIRGVPSDIYRKIGLPIMANNENTNTDAMPNGVVSSFASQGQSSAFSDAFDAVSK